MADKSVPTRAEILALAVSVFGNESKAMNWLNTPKTRFAGQIPMDMLGNRPGRTQIFEMLVQLQEGYSF